MQREPTEDERYGISWWNGLDEPTRALWMEKVGNTGRVAEAWEAYNRANADILLI
jgi:hypothetical protein